MHTEETSYLLKMELEAWVARSFLEEQTCKSLFTKDKKKSAM